MAKREVKLLAADVKRGKIENGPANPNCVRVDGKWKSLPPFRVIK